MNPINFSKPGRNKANQDAVLSIRYDGLVALAIADGMGGKPGGEVASTTVIDSVKETLRNNQHPTIQDLFKLAHEALIKKAENNGSLREMGTTLSICLIANDTVHLGHVGDTRVYHLRNDGLITQTKDQTEVQHLLDEGVISKKKAASYKRKNVLLSVLTPDKDYELQNSSFEILQNDRLLLTSDGLYSLIQKLEIKNLSKQNKTVEELSKTILSTVESRKIHDDYSAVIYQH